MTGPAALQRVLAVIQRVLVTAASMHTAGTSDDPLSTCVCAPMPCRGEGSVTIGAASQT